MSSLRLSSRGPASLAILLATVFLVTGAWLVAGGSAARAETLLRWKFTAGEHLIQTFDQDMEIEMQIGEVPIKSTIQQTMSMSWHVNAVDDDGVASTSITIDRMRMAIKAQGHDLAFDTADKDKQQDGGPLGALSDAVSKLIGMRYDVRMASTGEIVDVSVPEATREALKQQFSAVPGMQQMADAFSDEGIKNMAGQSLHVFPAEPVSPGDTWTREGTQNIAQLGKHTTKTVYEYIGPQEVDGRMVEQLKATMETDFEDGLPAAPGATLDIKDQQTSGVIQFDNTLGRMTRSDFDIELASTLSFGGQSMDQQISGKIITTIAPATDTDDEANSASEPESDDDETKGS